MLPHGSFIRLSNAPNRVLICHRPPLFMHRVLSFCLIFFSLVFLYPLARGDEPLISITSPDAGTTFAFGTIKQHSLYWDKKNHELVAHVIFTDVEQDGGPASDDIHDFHLPGITFDEAKGLFFATSAQGEAIPVAKIEKILFAKTIEILPNAVVRINHRHGNIEVKLEAISPNDPALHAPVSNTQTLDIHQILHE